MAQARRRRCMAGVRTLKYEFKTTPYPHQVRALKKVVKNKRGALFMPMRSGKTKTAIDWCGALNTKYSDFNKVLIVCPLSVVGVWRHQFKLHCPVPYYFNDSDEVITESEELIVECINYEQL